MGKGDEAGGDFHRHGSKKTRRKQKTFQKRENKNEGGETPLLTVLGSLFCQGARGTKERGDQENLQTLNLIKPRKTFNNEHRTQETLGL